jgi:hypothetical protein
MEMGPKATPDQLTYSEIIELPNITQDELYIKANSWFVDNFNDAESVIQFQDKEAGKLMGKYVTSAKMSIYNYRIKSTIQIDLKENKVRVTFKDPYFKAVSDDTGNVYNESYKPLVSKDGVAMAQNNWKNLNTSLKEYLNSDDNW